MWLADPSSRGRTRQSGQLLDNRAKVSATADDPDHPDVFFRLEKFDHIDGQHRYYLLSLTQTLFGEWCVEQTSGPLGQTGGSSRRSYFDSYAQALTVAEHNRDRQIKRGFVPIPVQLGLL